VGTASKFQNYIEEIEDDQPPRGRRAAAAQEEQGSSQSPHHPLVVQNALNALLMAAEGVSKVIAAQRGKEAADAAGHYQRLLDDQRVAAEADLAAAGIRIADLEMASVGAGEESWGAEALVEELRTGLSAAEMARDQALAATREVAQRLEVELAHANASSVQIEVLRGQVATQVTEINNLRADARWLAEATDLGHKLRVENASLTERTASLTDQVNHLETLLRDANERHERERGQIRADHERALAEERQGWFDRESKFGWLGAPVNRTNEGGRS
jgi:hypothetical protein